MSHGDGNPSPQRQLEQLIADYLRATELGMPVDREALLAPHPDLADHLRAFFASQDHDTTAASDTEDETIRPIAASEGKTLAPPTTAEESTHGRTDDANADPYATKPLAADTRTERQEESREARQRRDRRRTLRRAAAVAAQE